MPPKVKPTTDEAPRRSTRARSKRPAASGADEPQAPVKHAKSAQASKPEVDATEQTGNRAKPKQGKNAAVATHSVGKAEDLPATAAKSVKAAKNTKTTKQPAQPAQLNAAQQHAQPPAPSTATQTQKSAAVVQAATQQAGPSDSTLPAAADPACPKAQVTTVAGDADVMLNQTNIGSNNNKY